MGFCIPLLAAALLAGPVRAGGDGLAGSWKVTIFEGGQYLNFWLLKLESKDGKLVGEAQTLEKIPETTVTNVQVNGDLLNMAFRLKNGIVFTFEGKLPRVGAKKIYGSITRSGNSTPAFFESTQAKNAFEIQADTLTKTPNDPRVFSTLLALIAEAKEQKTPTRDIQEWIDGVLKTAENYGPTWNADYGVKLVANLRREFPTLAAETALRVEKSFDAKTPLDAKLRLLTELADAYKAAGKAEEAAKIEPRIAALELDAKVEDEKNTLNFKIDPYAGKVNQPVLVELFTGAQCPPCVAADIGFDGLGKAFKETEIALLQYHLHIPDADALSNADAETRAEYYAKTLRGTPGIYFNGKALDAGGGGRDDGEAMYKEYRSLVDKLVGNEPGGKLTLSATRKDGIISIKANATDVEKGPVRLRFALVEDWARYKGRNGLTFHHRIVRAMPGGPEGFAVDKELSKTVTVDVADLKSKLSKYLDDYAKNEGPFPDAQRPLRLRDFHVVAFLQNDATKQVLQSISVPVRDE